MFQTIATWTPVELVILQYIDEDCCSRSRDVVMFLNVMWVAVVKESNNIECNDNTYVTITGSKANDNIKEVSPVNKLNYVSRGQPGSQNELNDSQNYFQTSSKTNQLKSATKHGAPDGKYYAVKWNFHQEMNSKYDLQMLIWKMWRFQIQWRDVSVFFVLEIFERQSCCQKAVDLRCAAILVCQDFQQKISWLLTINLLRDYFWNLF